MKTAIILAALTLSGRPMPKTYFRMPVGGQRSPTTSI